MSKSALVISGGGSKGAFAGGVAQYLIEETKHHYDLFLGTSTGSLLVSHLALNKIEEIKKAFISVNFMCAKTIKTKPEETTAIKLSFWLRIKKDTTT